MLFNSLEFAFFLPCVLLVYYALNPRAQNLWLLGASYAFYAAWDWRFLVLIFLSTCVDYFAARKISRGEHTKPWLYLSLAFNLGMLGLFKYFNFFVDSFIALGATIGMNFDTPVLRLLPPVGISFYTFQTLSYTIDVYRRQISPETDFSRFALFVSYFPQLVAGPIERAERLLPQIQKRRTVSADFLASGLVLILIGLFKKVVIADTAGVTVDQIFAAPEEKSSLVLLNGVLLFALQIYGDFSGYSNIARGVSRLFGIELMENFKTPYFAQNVSEFWRRWHISLSEWLRDYLYIALGGNRAGKFKTYRNLLTTMVLGGLWHGAAWTFVIWGVLHGLYLVVHRFWRFLRPTPLSGQLPRALAVVTTFSAISFAWLFFRAEDLSQASLYITGLLSFRGDLELLQLRKLLVLGLLILPLEWIQYRSNDNVLGLRHCPAIIRLPIYAAMLLGVVLLSTQDSPFIYFQF